MGRYIEGPEHGKAKFIVSEYDAKYWAPEPLKDNSIQIHPLWGDKPKDMEWVIVVDNGPFEAAGWLYDRSEFDAFQANADDRRPRTYLWVPVAQIKEIFPEYFKEPT